MANQGISAGDAVWTITGDTQPLDGALSAAEGNVGKTVSVFEASWAKVGLAATAAGAAITGALGLAVSKAGEFGKGMAEISSLGVSDLASIEQAVKDVSIAYGMDLADATNAAYQALSSGVPEGGLTDFIEKSARAATAGMTDLSVAIEHGSAMTNVFGGDVQTYFDQAFVAVKDGVLRFEDLNNTMGRLAPTFSAAGLSSKEMYASVAALTTQGIKAEEAVTGMKAVMSGIIKPTSEAEKAAAALGIQFDINTVKTMGLTGFLDMLAQATGGNIDTMAQLFGSVEALNAVMALTGEGGAAKFSMVLADMSKGGSAVGEAFDLIVAKDPTLAFRQLQAQIKVLAVDIGTALMPALKRILDALAPILESVGKWVQENPALTATLVTIAGAVGSLLLVLGPLLMFIPMIASGFSIAATAIGGIIPVFSGIISAIVAAISAVSAPVIAVGALIGAAIYMIVQNWEGIVEGLDVVWDAVVAAGEWVVGVLSQVWDSIVGVFEQGWQWISDILTQIGDAIGGLFGGIADFFGGGTIPIEARASGGPVSGGMPYLVGEEGPELFVPSMSGSIVPNGGGGASVVINLNNPVVRDDSDIRRLSESLAGVVGRELRGMGAFA